jgi:hypothetical protein
MNSMIATRGRSRQPTSGNDRARPWSPSLLSTNAQWVSEATTRTVTRMMRVYDATGGVVSGDELSSLLRGASAQPISLIARWIVNRQVVTIRWRSQTLLPLFQFDLRRSSLRPPIERVIAELTGVFDDFELAIWFSQPNSWLAGASPVQVLGNDVPAVLGAARADRFVATG